MTRNEELEEMRNKILDANDWYTLVDEDEDGRVGRESLAVGNSGCVKIYTEMGLDSEILHSEVIRGDDGYIACRFTVCMVQDGKKCHPDVGGADTREFPTKSFHYLMSMACTRAWQRSLKKCAGITNRLVADRGTSEKPVPGAPGENPQKPTVQTAREIQSGVEPRGDSTRAEPVQGDCGCDLAVMQKPYRHENHWVCATCGRDVNKEKRIEYLSRYG